MTQPVQRILYGWRPKKQEATGCAGCGRLATETPMFVEINPPVESPIPTTKICHDCFARLLDVGIRNIQQDRRLRLE